jgi:HAD superfamily hydrolase (TIGR01509 family)
MKPNTSTDEKQNIPATTLRAKAFFFDLDGTIVNSRNAYLQAARTAFQGMGQKPPEKEIALEIPRRLELKQSINSIAECDTRKFLEHYLNTYYAITREKTELIPNIRTALESLSKKAKLALITMRSTPNHAMMSELEYLGIAQYFVHVATAFDTHEPKPSPEALTQTSRAIDVPISDCVMVGDSISDIRAGKAAGSKTVAVLSGLFSYKELAKEHPDLILKNATLLPKHVEQ